MDKASLPERLGVTPGKMALIVALAITLVGVVYYQYRQYFSSGSVEVMAGVDSAPDRQPRVARRPAEGAIKRPIEEQSDIAPGVAPAGSVNPKLWQAPDLASVVQYDPFALPASFPQPASNLAGGTRVTGAEVAVTAEGRLASLVEELQMQLEELRQRGVTVIVKHQDEYAAMIGDRTVHVGDEINGFTVTAIEPGGVHVERKIQQ